MSRRVSLPGADELFRPTRDGEEPLEPARQMHPVGAVVVAAPDPEDPPVDDPDDGATRRSSGRVRHDEKMTVYVTADELFELETARLSLRRVHGVAVDRGRLVREAMAIVLEDLDERGADSAIARRLAAS